MFSNIEFAPNSDETIKQYRKSKFLNKVANTMFKVHIDDLQAFNIRCDLLGISVDASHLDYDNCLTLESKYCVEVVED